MKLSCNAEVFVYRGGNQKVPPEVERVRIHEDCKTVEKLAFVQQKSLRVVEFSEGLVEICEGAFRGCEWLQYIITPSSLQEIGKHAFSGCMNMKFALLNEHLWKIGISAFSHCHSLKYVHLPPTVSVLNDSVFEKCRQLEQVALSPGKICNGTFKGCLKLKLIVKSADTELDTGALPKSKTPITIATDYEEASKLVLKKVEEVIANHKKNESNLDKNGLVDVKPTTESTTNEERPSATENSNELKDKEVADLEARLKEKSEELIALQEGMKRHEEESEAKYKNAMEEKEALEAAKSKLEQDNERISKAFKDISQKDKADRAGLAAEIRASKAEIGRLRSVVEEVKQKDGAQKAEIGAKISAMKADKARLRTVFKARLQKAKTENVRTLEKLHEITGDRRALKAENARLQQEKEDNAASLLKMAEKCGALLEQIKRLRAEELESNRARKRQRLAEAASLQFGEGEEQLWNELRSSRNVRPIETVSDSVSL